MLYLRVRFAWISRTSKHKFGLFINKRVRKFNLSFQRRTGELISFRCKKFYYCCKKKRVIEKRERTYREDWKIIVGEIFIRRCRVAGAKVIRKLKATRVYETDSCSCLETLSASREADRRCQPMENKHALFTSEETCGVGPRFAGGEFHFLRGATRKRSHRDGFFERLGVQGGMREGKWKRKKAGKIGNAAWNNDSRNLQSAQIAGNNTTDIRKLAGPINDEKSLPFRVERNFSKKTVRLSGNE